MDTSRGSKHARLFVSQRGRGEAAYLLADWLRLAEAERRISVCSPMDRT
jgi:hypothetical protein